MASNVNLQLVPKISALIESLEKLAELSPDRLTLSQAVFFLAAAKADLSGRATTFSEIRDELGSTISKSLHTTYKVFVDGGRNRDGARAPGLGWLKQELDITDNRRKYLRLTPAGREVCISVGLSPP